jgi:hypothetical protein
LGSGGGSKANAGGSGGGLVWIVAGAIRLDGAMRADGGNGSEYDRPGGSGGGIRLDVSTLSGNGIISAGGDRNHRYSGSGGGGRIAIYAPRMTLPNANVSARGGAGGGAAGTVFIAQEGGWILSPMRHWSLHKSRDLVVTAECQI